MRTRAFTRAIWLGIAALTVLIGSGATTRPARVSPTESAAEISPAPNTLDPTAIRPTADASVDLPAAPPAAEAAAPLYNLNWYSINGGGATKVTGANFQLGMSAGQAAAGFASGTNFKLGVGFWYGAAAGAAPCLVTITGDVNLTGNITSADIINLVNFVFKGGAPPLPCEAAGDVNCNGTVTSADIINLVNFVFKGGAPPCDVCNLIPSMWSCP